MSILKIARLGHPVLRAAARPLTKSQIRAENVQRLIDDMIETMREYGGVGLAAPQVHVEARIAVIEAPPRDESEPSATTILVNPVVIPLDDKCLVDWEGCLSIPDLRGEVPRAARIGVEAQDRQGRALVFEAAGFLARVVQHECDHLEGVVFLDRMPDLRSLSFIREQERFSPDDGGAGEE
ncbi:MAG: peptide deformylase [Vicinamibacteria bacterium]|nr:peptide deformylase [Vicinamibacteria bacterium]